MTAPRTIHLRRPPVVVLQETPFVPRGAIMDEVDRRWAELLADNASHHDGRLCHVLGVHRNGHGGASIHVADCAYRFYAVQDAGFDLGVRHLGVKGITSHDGRVLLGRRADHVMAYPGMWEFAPGGVLEPGREPAEAVQRELAEETGLSCVKEPTPIGIVFDPVARCWEIVYRIAAGEPDVQPQTDEYSELRWCDSPHWPEPLSPPSKLIAALV